MGQKDLITRICEEKVIQNGVHQELYNFFPHRGFIKRCDWSVIFKSEVINRVFFFALRKKALPGIKQNVVNMKI